MRNAILNIGVLLLLDSSAMAEQYLVIDLSEGPTASHYPVSYLQVAPTTGWSDEYKGDRLVLRQIKAGAFTMGSPESELGRSHKETQHEVTISKPFYIGVFELTQKQWRNVMGTSSFHFPGDYRPADGVTYPMVRGTSKGTGWPKSRDVDEDSFIGVLRTKTGLMCNLPTEAQWEYACRAGTTTALNNGKNLTANSECPHMAEVGRYKHNKADERGGYQEHTTVGSYRPNDWGLYDMHGNVWEWCLDLTSPDLGKTAVTDPAGPSIGTRGDSEAANSKRRVGADPSARRIVRGGCYSYGANGCRSAFRSDSRPDGNHTTLGFRVAVKP